METYKISTISGIFETNIPTLDNNDLLVLSQFIDLDENNIVSLSFRYARNFSIIRINEKYKDLLKKKKNLSANFFNQLNLKILINNNIKTVKIFSGGKIHVSGAKNLDNDFTDIYNCVINIFKNFKINNNILLKYENGLYIYEDNFIVSKKYRKIIGIKTEDTIIINNDIVYFQDSLLISKKYKKIYNTDGEIIDKIIMIEDEIDIQKSNNNEIINFKYDLKNKIKDIKFQNLNIILINAVTKFKDKIDKQKFSDFIKEKYNYSYIYDLNIHSSIKIYYYFNESNTGICNHNNKDCTCEKCTLLISKNGTCLLYGFNNMENLDIMCKKIHEIYKEFIKENLLEIDKNCQNR